MVKIAAFIWPKWVQGSTDDFLVRVKSRADELGKLPIHIHTLQSPYQKAYGIRKYGKSLLGHLDDLGLVDDNLVLGHAVYVNESDIQLLATKKPPPPTTRAVTWRLGTAFLQCTIYSRLG